MVHLAGDVAAWGSLPSAAFYAVYLTLVVVLGMALDRALERVTRRVRPPRSGALAHGDSHRRDPHPVTACRILPAAH
jgi:hypothetical protein